MCQKITNGRLRCDMQTEIISNQRKFECAFRLSGYSYVPVPLNLLSSHKTLLEAMRQTMERIKKTIEILKNEIQFEDVRRANSVGSQPSQRANIQSVKKDMFFPEALIAEFAQGYSGDDPLLHFEIE